MALPALWTEASLLAAVEAELESVSGVLGLTTVDVLSTAVNFDVPSILGVVSVASPNVDYSSGVTNVVKVFRIAKWKAWQKALDAATVRFDVKAGASDVKQSQIFRQIQLRYTVAESEAMQYPEVLASVSGSAYAVIGSAATYGSPYRYPPDEFGI